MQVVHGNDTHRHNQVANTVHQEMANSCELPKGPSIPRCKYAPQSMLEKSNYKLYYYRYVLTYPIICNYRPDTAVLDKPS